MGIEGEGWVLRGSGWVIWTVGSWTDGSDGGVRLVFFPPLQEKEMAALAGFLCKMVFVRRTA